jgi:hypothetical protein
MFDKRFTLIYYSYQEGYMKKSDILNWIMRVSKETKKVRRKEKRVKNETLQKD